MTLEQYRKNRDLARTPAPSGKGELSPREQPEPRHYIIQRHHARTLHYDLRLKEDGVLKSWAVPKGPSLDPADKRLALKVEDDPLEYGDFDWTIPEGEYGAGRVIVWDRGTFVPAGDGESFGEMLAKGTSKLRIFGEELNGGVALVQTRWGGKENNWLFIKERDEHARPGYDVTSAEPRSVLSGRDLDELA